MRLTDIEKFMRPAEPKKLGTREVNLESKEVVQQMKRENSLALAKIKEIPQETREELKPYFSPTFFKEGNA